MTSCPDIGDRLLDAEPEELREAGDSELARHLRTCHDCAAAAAVILDGTARLRAALEAAGASDAPDAAALVRRALGSPLPAPEAGEPPRARDRGAPGRRSPRWTARAAVAALATAAGVAVALLVARQPDPGPGRVVPDPAGAGLDLETVHDVAVLPTADPDITVLWFFPTGSDRP